MSRRILLAWLSAASLLVSCSLHEIDTPAVDEGVLTVCLDPGRMGVTRATAYGEDKFNENVITNFRLYFYNDGADDYADAVYVYPQEGYALDPSNEAAAVGADAGVDPTTGKVTARIKLSEDAIKKIFPSSSTKCHVYAVANIKDVAQLPESTTINSLKKTVLTSGFGPDAAITEMPFAKTQDSFAMDGEGTLSLSKSGRSVTGEVKMYRAASKITFKVKSVSNKDIPDEDGDGQPDWKPLTDKMHVFYINGINRGFLNGRMTKAEREGASKEYVFSYKTADLTKPRALVQAEDGWSHELPFYSYFTRWSGEDDESVDDCGSAPYLLLSIPWEKVGGSGTGSRVFNCYYAVPFNVMTGHLDRNTWYQINLNVGILGSGDPDNPTELTPSYMILPWGNEVVTNANLINYRYLMVDQNIYEMHNIDALDLPYNSSHPVKIVSSSLTYTRLKPASGNYKPDENVPVDESKYEVKINDADNAVIFTHRLENDYTKNYDVSAFKLTVTIQHKDDPAYEETITVVQYPALYVRAELNSDCDPDHINSGTNGSGGSWNNRWSNNRNAGYVYVNGNHSRTREWNTVSTQNAGNTDPYMYVVNVSSLPTDSDYSIGDPRNDSYSSSFYSEWRSSEWLYGASHSLTYYYPGEETTRIQNMIAPSFRIASSYGVVGTITYDEAKRRCAGYQEDGYPAGRWRLPTPAEIKYMAMLAGDGKIPILLSLVDSDGYTYYWAADSKAYSPDGPNPGNTEYDSWSQAYKNYVRCVYDEWYWTDKCAKGTFTWGDKAR